MDARALLDALPERRIVGRLPAAFTSLSDDSRRIAPGALFVALRGTRDDGHAFVIDAVAAGASAVVVEEPLALGPTPQIIVPQTIRAASRLADRFYGSPSRSLPVAGITGTNGKTTTTYLLAAALGSAGIRAGVVGTLGVRLSDLSLPLANTTPLAIELHGVLAQLHDAGARAVAMEVSSHALALGRVDDVRFAVGAITNVTRDHLDFHGDFERYTAAKERLFDLSAHAVLNLDDPVGMRLAARLRAQGRPVTTYAIEAEADIRPRGLAMRPVGSRFTLGGVAIEVALPGRFNVYNTLAALAIADALGAEREAAARGIAGVSSVPGRMERFSADGVTAIVDYAHTPDALENVLRAIRETADGRLTVVFGCGGDRDPGKRPQMGVVAASLADRVIVTSDNPRSEDPAAIAQAAAPPSAEIELDRRTAIRRAIAEAVSGDTIVIAGKGHEPYQIVGDVTIPFDDRDEVRAALAERAKTL